MQLSEPLEALRLPVLALTGSCDPRHRRTAHRNTEPLSNKATNTFPSAVSRPRVHAARLCEPQLLHGVLRTAREERVVVSSCRRVAPCPLPAPPQDSRAKTARAARARTLEAVLGGQAAKMPMVANMANLNQVLEGTRTAAHGPGLPLFSSRSRSSERSAPKVSIWKFKGSGRRSCAALPSHPPSSGSGISAAPSASKVPHLFRGILSEASRGHGSAVQAPRFLLEC